MDEIKNKISELEILKREEKEVTEQLVLLTSQEQELKNLARRRQSISRKLRKTRDYLENAAYYKKSDLKEIVNKILIYVDNSKGFFFKQDKHYVKIDEKGINYNLTIKFTHLRDYDITKLINDIEVVLNMKISGFFVSAHNYTNGTSDIELHLTITEKL